MRLKEVVYTISPFETTVLTGLFKDVPGKAHKYWKEVRAYCQCCLLLKETPLLRPYMVLHPPGMNQPGKLTVLPPDGVACASVPAEMGGCWAFLPAANLCHLLVRLHFRRDLFVSCMLLRFQMRLGSCFRL